MKRFLLILLVSLGFLVSPSIGHEVLRTNLTQTKDVTVYTTKTGAKYHKSSCRYLSKSKIETTKKTATAAGYTACSVCKP